MNKFKYATLYFWLWIVVGVVTALSYLLQLDMLTESLSKLPPIIFVLMLFSWGESKNDELLAQ